MIHWPDLKFPPINLWVLGPAGTHKEEDNVKDNDVHPAPDDTNENRRSNIYDR